MKRLNLSPQQIADLINPAISDLNIKNCEEKGYQWVEDILYQDPVADNIESEEELIFFCGKAVEYVNKGALLGKTSQMPTEFNTYYGVYIPKK